MNVKNDNSALAFIETEGRAGIIAALDTMPKMAEMKFVRGVRLGRGILAVVFSGDVGSAKIASEAAEKEAAKSGKIIASNVIARPHEAIYDFIMRKSGRDIPVRSKVHPLAVGSVEAMGFTGMIAAADAGLKAAEVEAPGWLTAGGGQTSVFFRGGVGAVRSAVEAGKAAAEKITDVPACLVIPNPHDGTEAVVPMGKSFEREFAPEVKEETALGIIETRGFMGLFAAMDAGGKAAKITIQGWSKIGKGLMSTVFRGEVANVKSALEAGISAAKKSGGLVSTYFIARPHAAVDSGK